MPGSVLLIDDERAFCELLADELRSAGWEVEWRLTAADAVSALAGRTFDALVTDVKLGPVGGIELCERALGIDPDLPVIVMTAFGSLETAIAAIRAGAHDFVTKPFDVGVLALALDRAVRHRRLEEEVHRLRRAVEISEGFDELIGRSPSMLRLFRLLDQVATSDAATLIRGETGTGKELVARAIHRRSRRRSGPFVAINCAAIPEALLESELFGHARGAFTGAAEARTGLLERAEGGSVFLDEIGDMSPVLQAKLLRALQERSIRPVGAP
jgi:two-component system, NtrC family, response regulator AtoC